MAARNHSNRKGITTMIEQNPDLIQCRVQDRQEAIRDELARIRGRRRAHSLRLAIGMAVIRVGEHIRGTSAERPREPYAPPATRARYAR